MQASRILRVCVIANWALIVLMVALSYYFESDLPAPLRDWTAADRERDPTPQELIVIGIAIPLLGTYIVGSFGLLLRKRWGAWLFLGSVIGMRISSPFLGPTVEHAIPDALGDLSTIMDGLIIGLAFFSNALAPPDEGADLANLDR